MGGVEGVDGDQARIDFMLSILTYQYHTWDSYDEAYLGNIRTCT